MERREGTLDRTNRVPMPSSGCRPDWSTLLTPDCRPDWGSPYPPSPLSLPSLVDKLKTLPSLVLCTRAVKLFCKGFSYLGLILHSSVKNTINREICLFNDLMKLSIITLNWYMNRLCTILLPQWFSRVVEPTRIYLYAISHVTCFPAC